VGEFDRWQYYRWTEMVADLLWLYARTGDPGLLDLCKDLRAQGFDWAAHFKNLPYKSKSDKEHVFLANHGVNNAMGMKAGGLDWLLDGKLGALKGYETLQRWHGQANGAFSCDEQLAGLSPSQGTELCSVVEEMYSLESLEAAVGAPALGDGLERLAYNALPAAFDEGMWTHQYDQQANQVEVSVAPRAWTNNKERANLFGLEPEWGCCTANFHQGWPKFTSHLWMATPDGGLAAWSYAPCQVRVLNSLRQEIGLEVKGDYPFGKEPIPIRMNLPQAAEFTLKLRIPAWAKEAKALVGGKVFPGKAGSFLSIRRRWQDGEEVQLSLGMPVKVEAWHANRIVTRGPILFALDVPGRKSSLGKEAWADQERFATGPWNLGLLAREGELPEASLELRPANAFVFDPLSTPLELEVPARQVANWGMEMNSAADPPPRPKLEGPVLRARLIPYGAAKLRISVFPAVRDREAVH
jgi:hypothetical protein